MNSSDGTAQYVENLRTLYLYDEAASMHDYETYTPSNVTDGNTSSYWESADGAAHPQTLTVNLGSVQSIGSVTLDLPPAARFTATVRVDSALS